MCTYVNVCRKEALILFISFISLKENNLCSLNPASMKNSFCQIILFSANNLTAAEGHECCWKRLSESLNQLVLRKLLQPLNLDQKSPEWGKSVQSSGTGGIFCHIHLKTLALLLPEFNHWHLALSLREKIYLSSCQLLVQSKFNAAWELEMRWNRGYISVEVHWSGGCCSQRWLRFVTQEVLST